MEMPTLHRVEYYNVLSVINSLTPTASVRKDLIDAISCSNLTFGTGAVTLVRAEEVANVFYLHGFGDCGDALLHWYGPEALINLEG